MIKIEDVTKVATDLGMKVTDAEKQEVLNRYEDEQANDPTSSWSEVVENILYNLISESERKRKITDDNMEHIILNDIKQMDGDALEDLISYMYSVKVSKNEDETFNIETQDTTQSVEDIVGDNIKLFEKE